MRGALSSENAKENILSSLTDRKVIARLVQIFQGEEGASAGESREDPESEQTAASEPESPDESAPDRDAPDAEVEPLDTPDPEETTK